MKKYFINQKNVCIVCTILFCSMVFIQNAYSELYTVRKHVFNIVFDNELSNEHFAIIEQQILTYNDIECFREGCTAAADSDEKIRVSALAEAMHRYLYKVETSCCMASPKDGRTLKHFYLKELNKHSKNIF